MIRSDTLHITPEILALVTRIDEFKGAWRAFGTLAPERLSALRRVATIESIGSSTRIEGSKLSDREVERLLSNLKIKTFETRDEQEVAGYAEVMELVFTSWQDIALTENHVKQLHRDLLVYSEKDTRHRGSYKTMPNHVVAIDEQGVQIGVVFETATPFDTPRLMTELIEWVNTELASAHLHPLLVIGIWVVVFLEIHPFQDGNGRLSRVLTTLLLLRAGYAYVPYSSLESVIEHSKEAYYLALRQNPGQHPHRSAQLATVAGVLPARAGRASQTPQQKNRTRKTRTRRAAGHVPAHHRIYPRTWPHHDGTSDAIDERQPQHPQTAFPRAGRAKAFGAAGQGARGLV